MNYEIPYVCISHIGRCRPTNQDNFICDGIYRSIEPEETESAFFVKSGSLLSGDSSMLGVFDGMGGEECGDVAAFLAAEEAAGTVPCGDAEESLRTLCRKANARICGYADQNGVQSMGSTAALLSFDEEDITLCNIGDSKIFRLSGQRMEQISEDHICAVPYGMKPPLSQNLGIPSSEMQIEPYIGKCAYQSGDRYLICSDGLTDMVPREEIESIAGGNAAGLEASARQLLDLALSGGGRDNITVILCEIVPENTRQRCLKK